MRFEPLLTFGFLLMLSTFTASCSDNQTKPEAKKQGAASNDAGPSDTADPNDAMSGDDFYDEEKKDGDIASIEELLKQCGGEKISDAKPDDVIYEKTIASLEVTKNIMGLLSVKAQSTLDIRVTGAETKQTSTVKAESESALEFINSLAKSQIDNLIKENSGTTTFTNVPFNEYSALSGEHEAWQGVLCTFVPVTKVVNERGNFDTVVEFDPPLPSSISPRSDPKRYSAEIGDGRTFESIKATVKKSDNPALDGIDEITGEIRVEKVPSDTEITPEGGDSLSIESDIAYRITFDFGTPKQTFALGLPPEVTYYISHKKRDLVANVVDTKSSTTGIVTYVHKD